MSIQPEGEDIRRAIRWISDEKKYNPEKSLKQLVEAACLRFNLSPLDADYLFGFYNENKS